MAQFNITQYEPDEFGIDDLESGNEIFAGSAEEVLDFIIERPDDEFVFVSGPALVQDLAIERMRNQYGVFRR